MEHILHSHKVKYLERHDILVDSKHGFGWRRSTETQFVYIFHDIAKVLDTNAFVSLDSLDFPKTFDKVPHVRF